MTQRISFCNLARLVKPPEDRQYQSVEPNSYWSTVNQQGVELSRELQQVLAQYLGPDGVPPLGVVPERFEEISWLLMVVMVRIILRSPPIGLLSLSLPFLSPLPSACRRCACGTAGGSRRRCGQLVCPGGPGIAGLLQFRHLPSSLALCLCSSA